MALSTISNEYANRAMSPGIRENSEPWPAVLRHFDVQNDLSLQATGAARNAYGEWFSLPLGETMIRGLSTVRLPRVRFSSRTMVTLVALAGLALGVERLWRRSEHFRKQAALCAYFELKSQGYAKDAETWEGMTIDERTETVRGNLMEARESGHLKNVYRRLARHPWEPLPPDTPDSVNPWDLGSLSASEIEEMVAAGLEDKIPDPKED